jgi:hypothetical protein
MLKEPWSDGVLYGPPIQQQATMYLRQKDAKDLMKSGKQELFRLVSEKNDFLNELHGGDDWSFVIKAQALVEGSVTQAVLAHLGDSRLAKIVEVMPLVGGEVSKLAVAKELELLTAPQRRFVHNMAILRNRLAHRADQASFSFERHIASLDKNQRKEWQASIPWFAEDDLMEIWGPLSLRAPRVVIHLSTFMLTGLLAVDGKQKEINRKIDELAIKTTSELLRHEPT